MATKYDDPIQEFDDAVRAEMEKRPGIERSQAIQAVAKRDPKMHVDYLKATNAGNKRKQRIIDEKYEDVV